MTTQLFYQQLREVLKQEAAVVATIVKVIGSAPREVGAKMAVYGDGKILGTIGGGAGEGKAIEQALIILQKREEKKKASRHSPNRDQLANCPINQLIEIDLTGTPNKDTQGICGGRVQLWLEVWSGREAIALVEEILEVFETGQPKALATPLISDRSSYLVTKPPPDRRQAPSTANQDAKHFDAEHSEVEHSEVEQFVEVIQPLPILLIVGGGHVAVALAQSAYFAGFQIAVQDERPSFVTLERFPQASFLSHSISETLAHFPAHSRLYVALVARGYPQDIEALKALLQYPLAYQYVGAIGSQKRIRMVCQAIHSQGISTKKLAERFPNFHAPIGLDIGAQTPEEIAISICAELIKVRRGGTGRSLCDRISLSDVPSKVHVGERRYAHLS